MSDYIAGSYPRWLEQRPDTQHLMKNCTGTPRMSRVMSRVMPRVMSIYSFRCILCLHEDFQWSERSDG